MLSYLKLKIQRWMVAAHARLEYLLYVKTSDNGDSQVGTDFWQVIRQPPSWANSQENATPIHVFKVAALLRESKFNQLRFTRKRTLLSKITTLNNEKAALQAELDVATSAAARVIVRVLDEVSLKLMAQRRCLELEDSEEEISGESSEIE